MARGRWCQSVDGLPSSTVAPLFGGQRRLDARDDVGRRLGQVSDQRLHLLARHRRDVELLLLRIGKERRIFHRRVEARRSAVTRSAGTSGETKNGRAYSARANTTRIA